MARKAEWEMLKERSLKRFGKESIFGEGSLNSRLALVGEAPGKHEVEEGRPFVGNAGKLLDELLEEAGIDRSKLYVTNVVKVRPTKEGGGSTQNRPPRAGEIREGIDVLKEELDLVKPRALALLGSTLAKAMIRKARPDRPAGVRRIASDELEAIRRRAERLAGLKQDRHALMEFYAGAMPEDLERLGREER